MIQIILFYYYNYKNRSTGTSRWNNVIREWHLHGKKDSMGPGQEDMVLWHAKIVLRKTHICIIHQKKQNTWLLWQNKGMKLFDNVIENLQTSIHSDITGVRYKIKQGIK